MDPLIFNKNDRREVFKILFLEIKTYSNRELLKILARR